jgi:predicted small metal-binding protein
VPRITCSDLGLGSCEHVIEAVDEDELQALAREHARDVHGAELDDAQLAAATRPDAPLR